MTTRDAHKGAQLAVRIPPPLREWLAAEADARDLSVARLVTTAVEHLPEHLHGGPVVSPPTAVR